MSDSKLTKLDWVLLIALPAAVTIGLGAYALRNRSAPTQNSTPAPHAASRSGSSGPRIISVTPLPGSTGGPPSAIVVTFDAAIDPLTINSSTFKLVRSGGGNFNDGKQ